VDHPVLVALHLPLRAGDIAFTFAAGVAAGAQRGTGVIVPFGRRLLPGIVLGEGDPRPDLRPVVAAVGTAPLIPAPTVDLAEWTAREYVSSVGEALAVATPWDTIWQGTTLRCPGPVPTDLSEETGRIAATLARKPVSLSRAGRLLAASPGALLELARTGILTASTGNADGGASHPPTDGAGSAGAGTATPSRLEMSAAAALRFDEAMRAAFDGGPRALLVAGWRRAPAYLRAAARARRAGWACIAAFPSVDAAIGFSAAAAAAGLGPVLLHGDLPPHARRGAWRALSGARDVLVVGTRGAVFAPVAGPVLVIVDDEDSSGHKEERAPRYLTAAVASQRTRETGVLVVGATTPTAVSYAAARSGHVQLVPLPAATPRIGVIDLRRRADPYVPISRPVLDAVRRTVRAGGRALLLTDRKGYAGGLHCAECGAVERCPQCGVAMPYDRSRRRLACRVCGRSMPAPAVCSRCGAARLHALGAGTERLVAELKRVVPRVWRFDAEAIGRDRNVTSILTPFRTRGGALVATTLVMPWLRDLKLDLVAVVALDRWLHRPEYRAAERTLAMLREAATATRVRVLVETADPTHPVLEAMQGPSLRPFYSAELALREALGYPPFRVLAAVTVSARTADAADRVASDLAAPQVSGDVATPQPALEILGPAPAAGAAASRSLLVKATDRAALQWFLWSRAVRQPTGARVTVDVDPFEL
jgi:primosomal protein N' (replication factor Y)